MKIRTLTARELDDEKCARWRSFQESGASFGSPYFCPELTLAVGAVRDDVHIAVLEEEEIVGFFPFQRGRGGACRPVGGALSDHHGAITRAGTRVDWRELLEAIDLSHWRFDHLVAAQAPRRPAWVQGSASPALDLSRGFEAYRQGRQASRRVHELDRKARKLAREIGPLRFEAHTSSPEALDRVLRWKSEQCRRTGAHDFFSERWARELVERILQVQTVSFAGALSVLYAGETLVAANLGMRSRSVWHWWFPVYDHNFAKYSPGALLLLRVAEAAAHAGAGVLDLGKGDDGYKATFADMEIPLAEGFVGRPSLLNTARMARLRAQRLLRSSNLWRSIRPLVRPLRVLAAQGVVARASSPLEGHVVSSPNSTASRRGTPPREGVPVSRP
jgi:CelD/BcsL family acetyltransferase involved in cellulose biosynthesis